MIGGFQNIAKVPELKKRILFTLFMLAVYRLGCHIPTPGIDAAALAAFFSAREGTLFGLFDMFSGGALRNLSVMALGIMPYISAAIILELLTVVVPHLEKLKKEGEAGRKKIQGLPGFESGIRRLWSPGHGVRFYVRETDRGREDSDHQKGKEGRQDMDQGVS